MEINDFTGIALVGIVLSLVIEWIQGVFGTGSVATKAIAIVLSVLVGGFYWFFVGTPVWQAVLGVLAAASTVYAIFFSGVKRDQI